MGLTSARPRIVAATAALLLAALSGGLVNASSAAAAPAPVPSTDSSSSSAPAAPVYSLTVVARVCPSYTDIQANRARNNLQETYSDLGIDAAPPYSDSMADNPVSPAREESANAAGYGQCTAVPDWTFSLGTGIASYGAAGVGASDHISVVTSGGTVGASATPVTQASTPMLNDAGQYVDAGGHVVATAAEAAQLRGATTLTLTPPQVALAQQNALWVQGGKAHSYATGAADTNSYQLNADEPAFAKADGSPLYSFGSLRCVTDALNGDNVESVALSPTRVHGYCFAYYVSSAPAAGTITVVKHVTADSGTGRSFAFTGNVSFTPGATDDANTDPFTVTAGGPGTVFARSATVGAGGTVWTVQESPTAGWVLDSLMCTSTGGSIFSYSVPSGGVNSRASITLAAGDDVVCTATNSPLTTLTVHKVDSITAADLAGATFALHSGGVDGALAGTCTTAADGLCHVTVPALGSYFWVETAAPSGYLLNPDASTVEVTAANAGTSAAEFTTAISDTMQIITGNGTGSGAEPGSGSGAGPVSGSGPDSGDAGTPVTASGSGDTGSGDTGSGDTGTDPAVTDDTNSFDTTHIVVDTGATSGVSGTGVALANTGPDVSVGQGVAFGLAALGLGLMMLLAGRRRRD